MSLIDTLHGAIAKACEAGTYPAEAWLSIPLNRVASFRALLGKLNRDEVCGVPRGGIILMALHHGRAQDELRVSEVIAAFVLLGVPNAGQSDDQYVDYGKALGS